MAVTLVDSPALVAGVAFLGTLPWLVFALPAGALADRVDRRRSMLVANLLRAAVVAILVLVAVLGWTSLAALYAVALCLGIAEVVYDTSAQSILPQLIGREQLSRANGRLQAAELTANEFVGPPLGGVLVATGAAVAFATSSLLWGGCRGRPAARTRPLPDRARAPQQHAGPTSRRGCASSGAPGCCAPWPS